MFDVTQLKRLDPTFHHIVKILFRKSSMADVQGGCRKKQFTSVMVCGNNLYGRLYIYTPAPTTVLFIVMQELPAISQDGCISRCRIASKLRSQT